MNFILTRITEYTLKKAGYFLWEHKLYITKRGESIYIKNLFTSTYMKKKLKYTIT